MKQGVPRQGIADRIGAAVEGHPVRAFAAFLALHVVVWTALPALLFRNLPLDLIEALVYGREWQLGYDKLPPLPWWMVEAVWRMFGPDLFYYLLAQITVVTAFALVFALSRRLVGATGALVAILIIDGLHYFTFTAPKFNHDVIQLPFWALAGFCYWAALRHGRLLHWLLLGFAIGMALWAKYFVVVLAVPLVLFALIDRDARRSLATPGPYIAAAVALVIAAPHLLWLVAADFLPFKYAEARAVPFRGALDYVVQPPKFLLSQLGFLVPSLIVAAPYLRRDVPAGDGAAATADAFDRRIVTLLTFGPALTVVLMSLVSGRGTVAMWGYPLWLFLGLWIVLNARALERVTLGRIAVLWGAIFALTAVAFVVAYDVMPRYRSRYIAVLYPGEQLGAEMSRRFSAMTGKPLAYVVGTMWDGGNIGHYAPEHPRVLIDGRPSRAPWIDLGDLHARGAIVVWTTGRPNVLPPAYRAVAGDAEVQPPFTLPMRLGTATISIGWAVLRPRPVVAVSR
ncbi:MAG TPA: glycosyltransferase family 39 protein [Xanthobacteraceae bacterium]|nr:glycosyltransferase family 39 protein [Xanthobacteraceae bacterium]